MREFLRVTSPWGYLALLLTPIYAALVICCGDWTTHAAMVSLPILCVVLMLAGTSGGATRAIDAAYRDAAVRRVDGRHRRMDHRG